jgi:hypothetical protein
MDFSHHFPYTPSWPDTYHKKFIHTLTAIQWDSSVGIATG